MEVVFLRKFSKDLDKIKKPKDLKSVAEVGENSNRSGGYRHSGF